MPALNAFAKAGKALVLIAEDVTGEALSTLIVNKQRAQYGETKGEKQDEKEGKSPDENLPPDHYRHLTIGQLKPELKSLSSQLGLGKQEG